MKHTKLFLTSAIAMCLIAPAMAEPSHSGSFPANGLMQPDYTYTNAATSTNMDGVYEGDVDAVPQYTDVEYNVTAGNYLPAASESLATCTAGNFCPGLQNTVHYHATNNQGLNECPSGYGNSATGASANTDCYRACAVANNGTTFTNIPHATAVSGNDYYNTTATDTCEPTACENGWHVKAAVVVPELPATGTGAVAGTDYVARGPDGTYCNYDNGCMDDNDWDPSDLAQLQSLGLSNGDWRVTYGSGSVTGELRGIAQCSTQGGTAAWSGTATTSATLPDSAGRYCWCKPTSWIATGESAQSVSGPWVFLDGNGDADGCARSCADLCADDLRGVAPYVLAFRAAVFGSLESSPAICEANTITINWTGTTQAAIDANEAGTATYGGNIRTPQSASHVPGKTFTGWLFSAPSGE